MRIKAIMDRIFRSCLVKDKDMVFPRGKDLVSKGFTMQVDRVRVFVYPVLYQRASD
jgi:hypothetical protein